MSTGPERAIPTGPGQATPGHPAGNPARSLGWRLRHSAWLLIPALGIGCLGGIGFVYVGVQARRPAWWISGIGYLVLGWTSFIVVGSSPQRSVLSDVGVGVFLATYVASLIHAAVINGAWLRWRATWVPWYAQPAVAPPPTYPGGAHPGVAHPGGTYPGVAHPGAVGHSGPPYGGAALPPGLVPPPGSFYGPEPSAVPTVPPPPGSPAGMPVPAVTTPPPPAVPAGPPGTTPGHGGAAGDPVLDVNTIGYEQLVALPGFAPDRAARVLAQRQAQRGFGSVQEFAAVAGLAPHEFARLRDRLVCAPPRPGQTAGPAPGPVGGPGADHGWGPPQPGRVLDV